MTSSEIQGLSLVSSVLDLDQDTYQQPSYRFRPSSNISPSAVGAGTQSHRSRNTELLPIRHQLDPSASPSGANVVPLLHRLAQLTRVTCRYLVGDVEQIVFR